MAEWRMDKKSFVSQNKKRPTSAIKVEKSQRVEQRPTDAVSVPAELHTEDFLAKEERYKLLNAELEARTAQVVREAEQLMRGQSEVLSTPLSNVQLIDDEDIDYSSVSKKLQQEPGVKMVTKKRVTTPQNPSAGRQRGEAQYKRVALKKSHLNDFAAAEDSVNVILLKTIKGMEKINDSATPENVVEDLSGFEETPGPSIADAQIRVLKAKLRIMQEELDQLSGEYYKKDDESTKLSAKIKELEEDRAKLQRNANVQLTQIEKHKALAEESAKKCDGLQLQVSSLSKEIENLSRTHKQAAAVHSSAEVRLNRALEEVERLKTQLNKMQQINKDKVSEELQSKENLLAENKMLKKQKAELILGFKKQLKLIDVLKKQKMHLEAAKLLSFTEDEFMKALDWGKS